MKDIAYASKAIVVTLFSFSLLSASDSPPACAASGPTSSEDATAVLASRVKALENKICEMDSIVKALDDRVCELEAAMLRRRLDAPDKLHFYRECRNRLDSLQNEGDRNGYVTVADVNADTSGALLVAIPMDPIDPIPAPPPLPGPKPIKIVLPLPENDVELQMLCNAVDNMRDGTTPAVRALADAALRKAGDHGLAVLVAYGLYNDVPSIRTGSAEMLGSLGGMRVIRELIEAFYSAATPTVPPSQHEYLKMLRDQVSSVTENDFFFYIRRTSRAPEVAAEMVSWWDQHWQTVQSQLGEPKLDQTSPYYFEELRSLRTLKLVKRKFGSANYPADVGVPPGEVTRETDQPFKKTIPVLPRESIDGKAPPDGRDDPKKLRDENVRLRDLVP